MKKIWKRVCTGILALTTILTALPITSVQAAETQYWTESSERVGYIEHVMNDGTIHSTFNEGHMRVEGETAYCVDINTGFKNGYKTVQDPVLHQYRYIRHIYSDLCLPVQMLSLLHTLHSEYPVKSQNMQLGHYHTSSPTVH